ncbi:MAG: NUMOD3 domain-containing DNA-binding protein [Anaerolineales bacterium]|nr:NUMOD3 domain-containing DNA-binding protein [Anaerolineales bacterium]
MNTIFVLYQYLNLLNGKRYIGVTCDSVRRFSEHDKGISNARAFNNAVKKYGINNFRRTILALFDDLDAAAYHERTAINVFRTLAPDGYNLMAGANSFGYGGPLSLETRSKMSESLKGNQNSAGKSPSADTRAKLSIALKGNRHNLGHKASEETKMKMGRSRMGNQNSRGVHPSPETRARISAAGKGRIVIQETREKIRAALKGRCHSWKPTFSSEALMKLSEAKKGNKNGIGNKSHTGMIPWNKGLKTSKLKEAR